MDVRQCRLGQIQVSWNFGKWALSLRTSRSFKKIPWDPQNRWPRSQQQTVLVERVLCKVSELPRVLFYSLAHLCGANIGFPVKPLADMSKMYQILLCTYKDLCSLTDRQIDRQGSWWHHLTYTLTPLPKRGIITCSTIKYIQVREHRVLLKEKHNSYKYWKNIKQGSKINIAHLARAS